MNQWNFSELDIVLMDALWRIGNDSEEISITNFSIISLKFAIVLKF